MVICWPAIAEDDETATFSSETRLVPLSVTVQDKSSHLVTNLSQSAFQVYENGVLQPLKLFKREDVEISLGLIIDSSGSMRDKREQVAVAALDLVKDSNPRDEVFIVDFNDEAYLDDGLHQRHRQDGTSPCQNSCTRWDGYARRHPDVDQSSEKRRQTR